VFSFYYSLHLPFPGNGFYRGRFFIFPRLGSLVTAACAELLSTDSSTNLVLGWRPYHTNLLVFSSQADFQQTTDNWNLSHTPTSYFTSLHSTELLTTDCGTWLTLLITFRHEPHREHRFPCYSTIPRQLHRNGRLFISLLHSNGCCLQSHHLVTGLHAAVLNRNKRFLNFIDSICIHVFGFHRCFMHSCVCVSQMFYAFMCWCFTYILGIHVFVFHRCFMYPCVCVSQMFYAFMCLCFIHILCIHVFVFHRCFMHSCVCVSHMFHAFMCLCFIDVLCIHVFVFHRCFMHSCVCVHTYSRYPCVCVSHIFNVSMCLCFTDVLCIHVFVFHRWFMHSCVCVSHIFYVFMCLCFTDVLCIHVFVFTHILGIHVFVYHTYSYFMYPCVCVSQMFYPFMCLCFTHILGIHAFVFPPTRLLYIICRICNIYTMYVQYVQAREWVMPSGVTHLLFFVHLDVILMRALGVLLGSVW
jgi:hypothetical protein